MSASVQSVYPPSPPVYAETRDQAVERRDHEPADHLEDHLDLLARRSQARERRIHSVVHFGEPAEQLIEFARGGRFDLIVMAAGSHSGHRQALDLGVVQRCCAGASRSAEEPQQRARAVKVLRRVR
jgi:nucleotide-binding universal stress UspA family protein